MPRVLAIDDSRPVRMIVAKQMKELGLEMDEAEDGVEGLARLEETTYDLIILDVTMPNMDGPTMLAKLREKGNQTPVIMLTSESKRSIVSEAMRLGIDDYVLKPFKPAELMAKVRASLKLGGAVISQLPGSVPAAALVEESSTGSTEKEPTGKQFIDIVVVDDMENVPKRLRTLLPPHITLSSYSNAQSALAACREKVFRVIVVDSEIPDVDSTVLAGQMKLLQPHAALVALALKSTNDVSREFKANGFSDVLFKPFSAEAIEDFILQYFDKQELLIRVDNLLTVGVFSGRADREDRYYNRLDTLFPPALEQVASACFEDTIVDLSGASTNSGRVASMLVRISVRAKDLGLAITVVGRPELKKLLAGFEETKDIPIFPSLDDARARAA